MVFGISEMKQFGIFRSFRGTGISSRKEVNGFIFPDGERKGL